MESNNQIFNKIARIQGKIRGLARSKENKFQKYFYFTEEQAIRELKPLLEAENLALTFSDGQDFHHNTTDKGEHVIRYQKTAIISDGNNKEFFLFWAMGQDTDIAKAKGKAETYAIKYFLTKFWMIPIEDELDPDQEESKKKKEQKSYDNKETAEQIRQRQENQQKVDELLAKHGLKN